MEDNTELIQVIQEMQAEINTLKKENQALRMKLTLHNQGASGPGEDSGHEKEEGATDFGNLGGTPAQSSALQPGSVSMASAPARWEHQGNVMIVRRYPISLSVRSFAAMDPWKAGERYPITGLVGAQGIVKPLASPSVKKQDNGEKMFAADFCTSNSSNKRALPKHVFGCRDKIKAVSFLLPMDIPAYSINSRSLKYSPNETTTNHLSTIVE